MAEALQYPDSDFSDEETSSPLNKAFNRASDHIRKITGKLNNDQLLQIYGLYKQSTEGNCNVARPGWLDGRGRRKWDAWKANEGTEKEAAKQFYIDLVQSLDPELVIEADKGAKESWVTVSTLRLSPEPELDMNRLTIFEAARDNCVVRLTELLKQNSSLKDSKDEDGLTALHWAADRNSTDTLSAAIAGGCPLDAVDDSGQTALHYAVSCSHVSATRILLDAGASTVVKDEDGATPLDLATDDIIVEALHKAVLN